MMALSAKQRSFLKGHAHKLHPVAYLGMRGITPEFLAEVERGLADHELIKVKIACDDQAEMKALVGHIIEQCQGDLVQVIGHILVLYRPATPPRLKLPQ